MNQIQLVLAKVTFPADLLALIDVRAAALDLPRGEYLRQLAQKEFLQNNCHQAANPEFEPQRRAA